MVVCTSQFYREVLIFSKFIFVYYRNAPNSSKLEQTINTTSIKGTYNFTGLNITGDTIFPITATAKTASGKTLTANNTVKILTVKPDTDVYTIEPKLWTDPWPVTTKVSKYDFENNKPVQFNLDLDAKGSTASLGIDGYQFSWWIDKNNIAEGDWTKQELVKLTGLTLYPSMANSNKEITIEGRVAVKDTAGHIRYARDTGKIRLEIVTVPPETEITVPFRSYPKEVTDHTSIKNIVTWSYFSEDDATYKESIVSLYKWNGSAWQPIFENQKYNKRELEITGNAEEIFKIVVKVVDEYGKESKPVEGLVYLETAKPDIDVTVDLLKLRDNILRVFVDNLTHPEVETLYPTSYTNWEIRNAVGTLLASGDGKVPEEILMDNRYFGTVVVVKQFAKNTLNNTTDDKDFYKANANLEIDVIPNRLFETELATVYNYARGLQYQEWGIKRNEETAYGELITVNDQFTRPKGFYNVMSKGAGIIATEKELYQYSNNIADMLKKPKEFTQTEIKSAFGTNFEYAIDSQYWKEDLRGIESGNYTYMGQSYKFRRLANLTVYSVSDFIRIKDVEFINGRPTAYFDVSGTLKAYKKVTVDGSKSIDYTDVELQEHYPIDFDSTQTRYIIEPLKGLEGDVDYSKNEFIKGEGGELIDGKVVFPAKKIQDLRFDKEGVYRITYITYNGLLESEPFSKEVVIQPELKPTVDINVSTPIVYRDPNYDLKAFLHVTVLYNSPDDKIDLDRSFLTVKYDANNDGDFSNDIGHQGTIKKNEESLMEYATVTNKIFQNDRAIISIAIDNPDKNLFGKYHFEFTAYEDPETPYFIFEEETFDFSADTNDLDVDKKEIMLDNTQPIINILMSRKSKSELTIIETSVTRPMTAADIQYILDYFASQKIQIDIKYIDLAGNEHNYKNY
ncbi:hypothetical protein [Thermotalea metallivorans]|uniref:Uncharacterized protein n=1 Tax=Thermotalea metallivorans TaxID=520762 RepID=A0A140KZP6_9FIRM|nr:hypothetical protein [Thermotalea metallivorans]KXG73771.1 hypothetical protein AN619_29050 [Thermotalea metallivorans]